MNGRALPIGICPAAVPVAATDVFATACVLGKTIRPYCSVTESLPTAKTDCKGCTVGIAKVLASLMTTPNEPSDTGVPESVTAGPLLEIVVPAMTTPAGPAAMVWPATV